MNNIIQLYTVRGQIVHRPPDRVAFSIPGMISLTELEPILPYLPDENMKMDEEGKLRETESFIPREDGGPLIKKMLHLNEMADEVYRKYAHRCDRVWDLMLEDGYVSHVSLEAIAVKVFECENPGAVTTPMLWCLHRVIENNDGFRRDSSYQRLKPRFRMLPPDHVLDSQTVQEWVRDYQETLASDITAAFDEASLMAEPTLHTNVVRAFVKKARSLIMESRKHRDPSPIGRLGPYRGQDRDGKALSPIKIYNSRFTFTDNEAKIIRCIADWVLLDAFSGPSISIGPAMLRAVDMYDGFELNKATGLLLLQEVGILLPWENRALYFTGKIQPLSGFGSNAAIEELHSQAVAAPPLMEDTMADLRKDWENLPIFCIDSSGTKERDDGISWETIDESTGWVHVHVANPSAFIDPASVTAQYATTIGQTIYLPEGRIQMLEPQSVRDRCSLAPNSPAITFSAKVTTDGDVLDTKITHSILRNVKILTYDAINPVLFPEETAAKADDTILTVGGVMPVQTQAPPDENLTDYETESLRRLIEAGHARRLKRIEGSNLDTGQSNVSFNEEPIVYQGEFKLPELLPKVTRSTTGDPIISLRFSSFDPRMKRYISPSKEFVGDLMVLAGEVASNWCSARGIPIVYSGTDSNPQLKMARRRFEEDIYEPTMAKHGYCPPHIFIRRSEYAGRSAMSIEPRRHEFMNLPAYTRISSPLRRIGDLLSHWQIDAAIRQEARTGASLVGNTDDSFLPFSAADSKEMISEFAIKDNHYARIKKHTARHWTLQWFNRAYYHDEAPIPKKFTIYILRIDYTKLFVQAMIMELGIQCSVEAKEIARIGGLQEVREGDTWEADVDKLDCYQLYIRMRLLKLVEKSPIEYQSWMVPKVD